MIPIFKPDLGQEELSALKEIFETGWIGLGPKTQQFEEMFADYIGTQYAVGLNSATAGLELALKVLNIGSGDEVLVPSMTFASSALACLYVGAKPVFVDCHDDTLCIDLEDCRKKYTQNTKAIIAVHFGGHACEMEGITEFAKENDIKIIEDCAHAAGGEYKGAKLGSFGDIGVFSFHAVKNLSTGDGCMVTFNNNDYLDPLRKMRWLGIDKDTWKRGSSDSYSWKYSIDSLGYKYHMSDITAVIGIEQLKKLDRLNEVRRKFVKRYREELSDFSGISCLSEKDYAKSANHNFVIKTDYRDQLHSYLAEKGISTGVHYEPINHHKVFEGYADTSIENTPTAEYVWTKLLTLPLYPQMKEEEFNYIITEIKNFHKLR